MNASRPRTAYVISLLLIVIGAAGILLSPKVGLTGGTTHRQFTVKQQVEERPLADTIVTSEFDLPFIENRKALAFMHAFIVLSIATLFIGVHGFATARNRY